MNNKQTTQIISSYYSDFIDFNTVFNYHVLRGRHIKTIKNGHHISRNSISGHEFIFCLKGAGWVKIENNTFRIEKNNMVWLPVNLAHEHYPDIHTPWEIYWIRIEGRNLDSIMNLFDICHYPVFLFDNSAQIIDYFEQIFNCMHEHTLMNDAKKDYYVTKLIFETLKNRNIHDDARKSIINHKSLRHLIYHLQSHYNEEWNIDKLTKYCNMSKSQLIRVFKSTFNEPPLKWIRHYRLSQARRLLVNTDNSISDISFKVGYKDPLHFSRDFKKFIGQSPTQFRIDEQNNQ